MKSRLLKHAMTSPLMEINLTIGDEHIKFNLHTEIKIRDSIMHKGLKNQPSHYGFLTMLHKNLVKTLMEAKVKEKKAFAHAYLTHKKKINTETNRPNSDDVAKQKAERDIRYIKSQKSVISIQYDASRIESCVRAFEMKKDILQTLSANLRKERG